MGNFLDIVRSLIREVLSSVERFACEGQRAPEESLVPLALWEKKDNCLMTLPIDNPSMWLRRQRGRHERFCISSTADR